MKVKRNLECEGSRVFIAGVDLIMQNKQRRSASLSATRIITRLSLLFLLSLTAPAGAQLAEMRADELISEANLLLESGQADEAVPYLQTYLGRAAGSDDARVLAMAQDVRFKLGKILIQQNELSEAAGLLGQYTGLRPAMEWRAAMVLYSTALFELGRFEECVQVATNALAGVPEEVRVELEAAAELAARNQPVVEDGAPEGYRFDEYGELVRIEENAVEQQPADPYGFSVSERLILNMNLGKAYAELGKTQESETPFTYVIEHTDDSMHRGYALMQVINSLVKQKKFDELSGWVSRLYRTDARYDIRVNLALMNAATALFDAKHYDSALPLFRMILPREELITHQSVRMWELQLEAGIATPDQVPERYRIRMDETLFGKRYSTEAVIEETWSEAERDGKNVNKPRELLELEEMIRTLESLPPYESEVLYRSAHLYDEVNRPWEAARFFEQVYDAEPGSEIGERSFYDMIRILLDPLKEIGEAEPRAIAYLKRRSEGLVPRQIAYLLTAYYQQNNRTADIKTLLPYLEKFVPSEDRIVLKYECELWYMQAVADVSLLNYEAAEAGFRRVIEQFPGSHQEENASYWHAVTLLFLEKYDEALAELDGYLKRFPDGEWVAAATFQTGTCLFGLERYDEALLRFSKVINTYPDSPVFPDACSLRGDIYGSRGLLDEAVQDYEQAVASARTQTQAKYATFQMAAVFESEDRFDRILEVVQTYLDTYGNEADISMGIYWIGKTMLSQGRVDDAVQTYFDAIVKHGGDLRQDGVDSIIADLVRLSKVNLSADRNQALRGRIASTLAAGENPVLLLRLRALLAKMNGTEVELGAQLIAELDNFENAAPPVLAAICDASFAQQDYSRSEELLSMFLLHFDDSEFMRSAYRLRGFALYESGDYDAALKLISDAQARYGTDYDVAWAQLMKGNVLTRLGRHAEAIAELEAVFNVVGWRGESYAEAAFLLAQAHEAAGNLLKAHGWYQRTYVQFKGYQDGNWAADAYLGSARVLQALGRTADARNTCRAMLFDKYVNSLPQAAEAVRVLGAEEALEIKQMIAAGVQTNITVTVQAEENEQ